MLISIRVDPGSWKGGHGSTAELQKNPAGSGFPGFAARSQQKPKERRSTALSWALASDLPLLVLLRSLIYLLELGTM